MAARFQVEIEPEQGYALVGGTRFALSPQENGALLIEGGALIRAVSFGERGSLIMESLAADDPSAALAESIASQSVIGAGNVAMEALRVLSVALAGGGTEGISFADAARRAGERENWSWEQTLAAPAWEVDRAAGVISDNGWSTFVFPSEIDLEELAAEMAANLLRRSVEPVSQRIAEDQAVAPSAARRPSVGSNQTETISSARNDNIDPPSAFPPAPATGPSAPNWASAIAPAREIHSPATASNATVRRSLPRAIAEASPATTTARHQPETMQPARWPKPAQIRTMPPLSGPAPSSKPRVSAHTLHTTGALAAQPFSPIELSPVGVALRSIEPAPSLSGAASWPIETAPSPATLHHASAPVAHQDWMQSLAQALEAECDMRGID